MCTVHSILQTAMQLCHYCIGAVMLVLVFVPVCLQLCEFTLLAAGRESKTGACL